MQKNAPTLYKQCWHFVLHLRWHYQLFILSGGFLLGGLLSTDFEAASFLTQFLNVHLLLFGGATAFNSFWDDDDGPVGGLANPPEMKSWMWYGAILLQLAGLLIAMFVSEEYVAVYILSMLFFWLYSSPLSRWKSHPIKSLVAIGLSTGTSSVLLGYFSAANNSLTFPVFMASLGAALILLSIYPVSQIYQIKEDQRRGDHTFAVAYGAWGVRLFFVIAFFVGLAMVSIALYLLYPGLGMLFFVSGVIVGVVGYWYLRSISAESGSYKQVMRIKYGVSLAFVLFLVAALLLKHGQINGISALQKLLF